jgi:hypothetical protein
MLESQVLEAFAAAQQDMRAGCWAAAAAKLEWLARVSPTVPSSITAVARAAPSAVAMVRCPPALGSAPLGPVRRLSAPAVGAQLRRAGARGPRGGRDHHHTRQARIDRWLDLGSPAETVYAGPACGAGDPIALALVAVGIPLLIVVIVMVILVSEVVLLQAIMGL